MGNVPALGWLPQLFTVDVPVSIELPKPGTFGVITVGQDEYQVVVIRRRRSKTHGRVWLTTDVGPFIREGETLRLEPFPPIVRAD
jgi:hypothetical protein